MDWWLAAAPALLATWANISHHWEQYVARNEDLGIGNVWSHFVWASHAIDFLHAPMRFSSAVCGTLGRHHYQALRRQSTQGSLEALRPWSGCFRRGGASAAEKASDALQALVPTPQQCPLECARRRRAEEAKGV